MAMAEDIQFLERKDAPALAYRHLKAAKAGENKPAIIFMGGFKSDMEGTKAQFLEDYCRDKGLEYVRFDYRGHGSSGGEFTDGTISRWKQDALDIMDHINPDRTLLIGSSMGGWIALLTMLERAEKVSALIGLAAAPDFTGDLYAAKLNPEQQEILEREGRVSVPNDYSDEPYIFTKDLFDDACKNFLLQRENTIEAPITLIQGMLDSDVPWEITARIQNAFKGERVDVVLIDDGDHRLSRPEDLKILADQVENLLGI